MRNILIILTILIIDFSYGKYYKTSISINQLVYKKWMFLTKFGVNEDGELDVNIRLNPSNDLVRLDILIYHEDNWDMTLKEKQCSNKKQLATTQLEAKIGQYSKSQIELMKEGIWYIAIAECSHKISYYKHQDIRIEIEFTIKNNGSHFSSENNNLREAYLLQLVITLILFAYGSTKFIFSNKEHFIYQFLLGSLVFDFVSELSILVHYQVYYYDGVGLRLLYYFGQVCCHLSTYLTSMLLILTANGFGLDEMNDRKMKIYVPIGILVLIYQFIIYGLTLISDETHYHYHDYTGLPGIFVLIFKFFIWVWFMFNLRSLISEKSNDKQIINFLKQLRLYGSIYLLSFPVIILVVDQLVSPVQRYRYISIFHILVQHLAILIIGFTFSHKKYSYQRIQDRTIL